MSEAQTLTAARTPTVYFIDDSATMREVIKIAFRKENIHVVTCADAASAIAQFAETAPDVVITDVIMPDKDGYEVCDFIKQHELFGKIPVVLMSGVVNRAVAEKAMAVKADELIRKPFQPQELILRVKNLLHPIGANSPAANAHGSANPLSTLFSTSGGSTGSAPVSPDRATAAPPTPSFSGFPSAAPAAPPRAAAAAPAEIQKLRNEVLRLELLVKKLRVGLEAEHQYCVALEAHIKTLQESA